MAKGRVPYMLFMLLDVLRAFPGQVLNSMLRIGNLTQRRSHGPSQSWLHVMSAEVLCTFPSRCLRVATCIRSSKYIAAAFGAQCQDG